MNYSNIITTLKSVTKLNPCVYSSALFLLNSWLCAYYGFNVYAALFGILTITSLLFHTTPRNHPHKIFFNVMDKIAVFSVVVYGAWTLWNNWNKYSVKARFLVIATFLSTIILFSVGYMFAIFCYDPVWGDVWHALLHIISVVGHAFLLLLMRVY